MVKHTLIITECDHVNQAFWTLGPVTHEVPIHALFDSLPDGSCTTATRHTTVCYMADLIVGGEHVDDREITKELAQTLLDEPIDVLRARFRKWLYETHGATG